MPKEKGPDSAGPGSLAWRRMQARKFVWGAGDVKIIEGARNGRDRKPPRPGEDKDRPDPERG